MKKIIVKGIDIDITDDWNKYSRDELVSLYWRSHPRFIFFKNCKKDSLFFDIGANEGELFYWKQWESPDRSDIKMYGMDMKIGTYSDKYEDFDAFNLEKDPFPYEDGFFDTMFSTHVIEHLKNVNFFVGNIYKKLKNGGTLYIESPAKASLSTPRRQDFIDAGFYCSTMNFHDDVTHINAYDTIDLVASLQIGGQFEILGSGVIADDYLSDLLISYGYEKSDSEITTYGLWLKFGWSNYVIAKKHETN
ncbi:MAG: methyltransferase domain-containing protein [Candidatus Taylorbacteria bacterium]